jgi:hypothetical protein
MYFARSYAPQRRRGRTQLPRDRSHHLAKKLLARAMRDRRKRELTPEAASAMGKKSAAKRRRNRRQQSEEER